MKLIFWLLLFFTPALLYGQQADEKSSLSKQYSDKGYELMDANMDSAMYYFNLAASEAKKSNDYDDLYDAIMGKAELFDLYDNADSSLYYHQLLLDSAFSNKASLKTKSRILYRNGGYLKMKNEFFRALNMLDSAAAYSIQINDSLFYADVLNKKGAVYESMGKRTEALETYLEALDIYDHYQDETMYGSMINNIAISYKKAGDFDNAMKYYNKSIELVRERNDKDGEAITRVNRGLLFKDMGEFQRALVDLHFALNHFEETNFNYGSAVCQHNLGETHLAKNDLDSALIYLGQSQEHAERFQYSELMVKNNLALAKLARKKKDLNMSNQYGLKAYALATQSNAVEDLKDINLILSDNFADLGDYRNSLKYFKEYKQTEDSIFNKESQFKLNILRTEYDLKYKDNEIDALQAKNEYQSNLAKERKKANVLLIIGIFATIGFLVILFVLYRRQRDLSKKLSGQKAQLIEQKEEIQAAQEQIVQQNESLQKINKEKDNLIAMVAHDLRSPLNQIRGVLGLIKMESASDTANQFIDIANQSSEVLSERINRILDIEAINAGKVNIKSERVEVNKVLEFLKQSIHNIALQKQMDLIIDANNELSCLADENYLLQVLENLCTNAIKYSPENSEIKISVSSEEKNVLFSVMDQGPGISDKEKANLFLPYSKTSNKPTGNESSTGLGLAIVKKYVEAMSGEVWVESEVNKGSVFYVKLPKAA